MDEAFRFPESGMSLANARKAIDALRGRRFVNRATGIVARLSSSFARNVLFGEKRAVAWITVKESKQHGHHVYSVETIKVEALDRIVEVVSGNTPHASSASTRDRIASSRRPVKGRGLWLWICGSAWLALGVGGIACNFHEKIEAIRYRGMFWGLLNVLCGALVIGIALSLDKRRTK